MSRSLPTPTTPRSRSIPSHIPSSPLSQNVISSPTYLTPPQTTTTSSIPRTAPTTPSPTRHKPYAPPLRPLSTGDSYFPPQARPISSYLSNIGHLASSPYDSDSEDEIATPNKTYPPYRPQPRAGTVGKNENHCENAGINHVRSVIVALDDDDEGDIIAFTEPLPTINTWKQINESGILVLPPPSRDPPEPTMIIHTPPRYPARTQAPLLETPTLHYRQRPPKPTMVIAFTPMSLPAPASPISPLLAAPPRPHFSLLSSPSSRSSTSTTSESIREYEVMIEKKALFRGGEDELMSPFSVRRDISQKQKRRSGQGVRASGVDFWGRFSTTLGSDQVEKADSEWLKRARKRRSVMNRVAVVVLILVLIGLAGIALGLLMRARRK